MQGEGTYQNPYLVETWEDFYSMQADGTTHYALANNLDARDYDNHLPRFLLGILDGAGFTIENIVLTTIYDASNLLDDSVAAAFTADSHTHVSNLTIKASSLASALILCVTDENSSTPAKFENCSFSVIMTYTLAPFCATRTEKQQGIVFFECSISIAASAFITYNANSTTSVFIRCHIAVNASGAGSGLVHGGNNIFLMCRIEGRIAGTGIGNMSVVNCVVALNAPNVSQCFITYSNENTNPDLVELDCTTTIVDKTLFPLYAETTLVYDDAAFLTTEEMKDIDVLVASGFTNVEEV